MQNRKFIVLLIVTLAVIVTASLISSVRAPKSGKEKTLLFPDLTTEINKVNKLTLKGVESSVELARVNDQWVIASSDNYPAIFDKVRALLIQFREFSVLAEKTRRPHLYYRLSVEDPVEKGSRAVVTRLFNDNSEEVASLIIGREKTMNAINPIPGFYGRIPDTETSLLITGKPDVSARSQDWFNTNLFHIPSELVQEVKIEHPNDDIVLLNRSDPGQPDFFLRNIPEDKKAQSLVIINRMGALLEDMVAEEVQSLDSVQWPDTTVSTTITTFSGLTVSIKLDKLDDSGWANFSFVQSGDSQNDSSENDLNASELNARHANWVYRIQDFKYRDLTKPLSELVRKKR